MKAGITPREKTTITFIGGNSINVIGTPDDIKSKIRTSSTNYVTLELPTGNDIVINKEHILYYTKL